MKRTTIIIFITSMICFTACGANSFSDSKAETENLESVREMIEQKEAEQAAQRKTAETAVVTDVTTETETEISTSAFQTAFTIDDALTFETTYAEYSAPLIADELTADIDLTKLSSTMVYSEVYNIMSDPESYCGKTIRVDGTFAAFYDSEMDQSYYAVLIADATACCQQAIEFVLSGDHKWPDDYPELDEPIEIYGVFGRYSFGDNTYYCIYTDEISRS
ncbi:hypothetical protein [Huintestinicola sp.]|uniref:hypothetical protein n=1 Tax=Huintestinicola sp. TaxID=2981661 RepID=UPI003D7C61A2